MKRILKSTAWEKRPLDIVAIAFFISISSYILSTTFNWGSWGILIGAAGTASCGFSWLLARALFKPDFQKDAWPIYVVALLVTTGILIDAFATKRAETGILFTGIRMAASLHTLLSSAVLLLAPLEAWSNYSKDFPLSEKRFRLVYSSIYAGLMAISVIWLNGVSDNSWADRSSDTIKLLCAGIVIVLNLWGWKYRNKHLHPKAKRKQRVLTDVTEDEQILSQRILEQLSTEKLFLEHDLKLSSLANALGESDHNVRNCITGLLGFRNFNHMINHYRIEAAKSMLNSEASKDVSILVIAFECGFSSIGPFNRAFKEETGESPTSYRNKRSPDKN